MVQNLKLRGCGEGAGKGFSPARAISFTRVGDSVSTIHPSGGKVDLGAQQRVADCVLQHRWLIGHRRWGMVQLYYRVGLSHAEIGRVFGINRQMVTYELRKAFRIVVEHLGRGSKHEQSE